MNFFKIETKIDFMAARKPAMAVAVFLVVASIVLMFARGLNFGIDFTGGLVVEVGYPQAVELDGIRGTLAEVGYGNAIVQHFGTSSEVLIRLAPGETEDAASVSNRVLEALRASDASVEMRRVEFVGPQVGDELKEQGGLAVMFALIGILIYVALRFEYRFAVGSVIALAHDVILTVGLFALLGIEFDLVVLAAILAVIGYSLNDTIVIFDRIRENFLTMRKASPIDVINASLNQTLARTLMTGITTLMVLGALYALGGQVTCGHRRRCHRIP
ncbi:MAG: protein translocase subunit SecF [Xanthomonadaceae bacterium]|nr:protein translocase subunit SecF [Xanthomonadaceae bacterium]